jgi:hypothetical protein
VIDITAPPSSKTSYRDHCWTIRSYMRRAASLIICFLTVGCVSPPNTPGHGSGANYTPVIDLQGVDGLRYTNDLSGCRSYANAIDANSEAIAGIIGGALIGAAIGSSYNMGGRFTQNTASYGGAVGGSAAGGRALGKQETIMANCMAMRGYRVLEGATVPMQPVQPMQPSPAYQPSPGAQSRTLSPPIESSYQPILVPEPARNTKPPPAPLVGDNSNTIEHLAEAKACSSQPLAVLTGKGPGVESYTMACSNGDLISFRCEFGQCRVLK